MSRESRSDERDAFSRHLADLERHPLLRRGEDLALAKAIASADIAAWQILFERAPVVAVRATRAELAARPPTKPPRQLATVESATGRGCRGRLPAAAKRAAVALRGLDRDRSVLRAVVAGVKRTPRRSAWLVGVDAALRDGDRHRAALVSANLRLVISIAKRYHTRGLDLEDRVALGHMGLLCAADRYDHRRGFRFSTYATWWIRQAITRGIADTGEIVRLPAHQHETIGKLIRAERSLGDDASDADLGRAMGRTLAQVRRAREARAGTHVVSLDAPLGDGGDDNATLLDMLQAPAPSPLDELMQLDAARVVMPLLDVLNERERAVISSRFGLGGDDDDGDVAVTLRAVGARVGLTGERVRQLEQKAMHKLRKAARRRRAEPTWR